MRLFGWNLSDKLKQKYKKETEKSKIFQKQNYYMWCIMINVKYKFKTLIPFSSFNIANLLNSLLDFFNFYFEPEESKFNINFVIEFNPSSNFSAAKLN